ncbi:hypothetical protein [Armatimonas sp.]|uniref:hypothetical protein n=1 Tax=Armatimonas sp. TaxID=1872638 RepID=UPI00375183CD
MNITSKFVEALLLLEPTFQNKKLDDGDVEQQLHDWLDGKDTPLAWESPDKVTPDEWFFVTTLYGEMTVASQRAHIRKYFSSLFIHAAHRNIRNFVPDMPEYTGLRSGWMSKRLLRMSTILREKNLTMAEYSHQLILLEATATPHNPMPALDQIIADHQATGWKTLSVFIRDCVKGNCFPIDTRVERELKKHGLPVEERQLVSLCLAAGKNPRRIARMFYEAGENPSQERDSSPTAPPSAKYRAPISGTIEFSDSDVAYKKWVRENPTGFVINTNRTPNSSYMPVHRATCAHISNFDKRTPGAFTERSYIKICASHISLLQEWVKANGRPDGTFTGNCPCQTV